MKRIRWQRLLCLALVLCCLTGSGQAVTLYWGLQGENVRQLQLKLQQYGYLKGAADGVFGQETYDAVVYFQRKNGLTVDGVAARPRWPPLDSTYPPAAAPRPGLLRTPPT